MVFARAARIREGGGSRGRFRRHLYGTQREKHVSGDEAEAGHCVSVGFEIEAGRSTPTLYTFVTVILPPFFSQKGKKK